MTKLLVSLFIKDEGEAPRNIIAQKYGYLCGFVGILTNLLLALVKILIGLSTHSIAITADAVNNFSDMGASIVTVFGFYYAGKPADEEHPFGHGRAEYLSALFLSFMVIVVGFQFLKTSLERIVNPVSLQYTNLTLFILVLSILVKIWQAKFYKNIGIKIDSKTLKAAAADSASDVAITSIVVLSIVLSNFVSWPLDGYIGLIVSALIMYSGFGIVKDTINPILGCAPDQETIDQIMESVKSIDGIMGAHDLIIHNYGAGVIIASVHAELSDKLSLIEAHEIVDYAEKHISKELHMNLLMHIDPINFDDPDIKLMFDSTVTFLKSIDENMDIHDFRVIPRKDKELVFDMDVPVSYDDKKIAETKKAVKSYLKNNFDIKKIYIEIDRGNIIA